MKQRIQLYDNAKGIGIILLVFGHLFSYGNIPFSIIFAFHMPLFFVFSGVFFSPSPRQRYSSENKTIMKIRKTIVRYLVPFCLFTLLGGIAQYFINGSIDYIRAIIQFFLYIGIEECMTGSLWFLGSLTISIIFMIYIERFCTNSIRKVIVICGLVILSYCSSKVNYIVPFRLKVVFTTTLFVFIGYYLKEYIQIVQKISLKWMIVIIAVFLLLAVSNKTVNLSIPVYNDYAIYFITSLLGIIITFWLSGLSLLSNNSLLSFCGKYSLIIFCTHKIWINIFVKILNLVTERQYVTMNNIPNLYCIIGGIIVLFLSIPTVLLIGPIYNYVYDTVMARLKI